MPVLPTPSLSGLARLLGASRRPAGDTPPPAPFAERRFEVLDALRGVAALGVAWFHYRSGWAGYLAVDFFLVLSGFVLSHGYLYRDRDLSLGRFVTNRLVRLYPLHLVTLLAFALTASLLEPERLEYAVGGVTSFVQHLTLTHNVGLSAGELTWNEPSWSISVEFWINVAFFALVTRATRSGLLLALSTVLLGTVFLQTGHLDTTATNYFGVLNSGLVRCTGSFLLGIVTYRVCRTLRPEALAPRLLGALEWVCVALCALVVFARDGKFSALDFAAPLVFCLTVGVFAFEGGRLSRLLGRFGHLGAISYSIYLNQITVLVLLLHVVGPELSGRTAFFLPLYTVVLLAVSHLTYTRFELPVSRALRQRIGGRRA